MGSSGFYFNIYPEDCEDWMQCLYEHIFDAGDHTYNIKDSHTAEPLLVFKLHVNHSLKFGEDLTKLPFTFIIKIRQLFYNCLCFCPIKCKCLLLTVLPVELWNILLIMCFYIGFTRWDIFTCLNIFEALWFSLAYINSWIW